MQSDAVVDAFGEQSRGYKETDLNAKWRSELET